MINIAKPLIGAEEKQAVLDVLDSGMIACGSVVSEFEKEFAAYLGIEHCTATTSGTWETARAWTSFLNSTDI